MTARRGALGATALVLAASCAGDPQTVPDVTLAVTTTTTAVPRAAAREKAIAKLEQVGLLPDTADLYPSELSGGMQKRAGLARSIATDPEILFLDEPTSGLDPIMSNIISELIVERVDELGATVISVVSDLAVVRNIADHVTMLHEGRVVWHGPI